MPTALMTWAGYAQHRVLQSATGCYSTVLVQCTVRHYTACLTIVMTGAFDTPACASLASTASVTQQA